MNDGIYTHRNKQIIPKKLFNMCKKYGFNIIEYYFIYYQYDLEIIMVFNNIVYSDIKGCYITNEDNKSRRNISIFCDYEVTFGSSIRNAFSCKNILVTEEFIADLVWYFNGLDNINDLFELLVQ